MPTDFGIAGSRNYKTDLGNISERDARSLLLSVKTQITGTNGTKSGVLKLVNLEGDGNITLKRKGIMSRMFQPDGADMRTTAETLKDLFEKAGFGQDVKDKLAEYLVQRSNRAGTRTISDLITKGFTGIGAASGADQREALNKLGVVLPDDISKPTMGGGRGKVVAADRVGETRLFKVNNKPIQLKLDDEPSKKGLPRLERRGVAGSAHLNGVPGVVRPEIYSLTERRADGSSVHHAVAGDKNFKNWAANHLHSNPGSTLELIGVVMPRAKGVEMMNANDKTKAPVVATVAPPVLAAAALDGLETLKKMSAKGLVHGDLKSPNMFIDTATGKLQFIDVDEILKMRTGQESIWVPANTSAYSHPNTMTRRVGFEQDLMGLGISILHTSLTNRGAAAGANKLQNGVGDYNKAIAQAAKDKKRPPSDPGFMKLRAIIEGAVPADALPAEILAVNWINAALDQVSPMAVRYDAKGDGTHLLDRVDPNLNPAMKTNLVRRTSAVAAPLPRAPLSGMAAALLGQEPQAPARPAQQPAPQAPARPVAAPPPPASRSLGATVEKELDSLTDPISRNLTTKAQNAVYPAVEAWTKGTEGMAAMAAVAAEGYAPERLAARIREILVDRINLEHLRYAIGEDPALKALPAESRTILEQQINRRATFEPQVVMNAEQLAERIATIRERQNI